MERYAARVYTGPVLAMVTHLHHVLDLNGIDSEVRGEYRGAGLGEIPITEAWPELWVLDSGHSDEARRIIREALTTDAVPSGHLECPTCRETVDAHFTQCWNCGAPI